MSAAPGGGGIGCSFFVMGSGSGTYAEILDQAVAAEELGFETVDLAERHFRHADLLCPSPFGMAAAIAARTTRIRIGTAARILSLDHPVHIAEDAATVDVLSGGRLNFGATRASLDAESHRVFRSPVEESHGRFREALEIIIQAWTKESFHYEGTHYRLPEVSVYPKPVQKPHPPVSLVTVSPDSLAFAARRGFPALLGAIRSIDELAGTVRSYREAYREAGNNGAGPALPVNRFIYVADSDHRARAEIERPFMEFIDRRAPDLKGALEEKYGGTAQFSFERFLADFCIFGSPQSVAARIEELKRRVGVSKLLCTLNYITLDHSLCLKSMGLFAREVMPRISSGG